MGIYDRFGVRARINAAGLITRLGGSLMPAEVLDAMTEAAGRFVQILANFIREKLDLDRKEGLRLLAA